MDYRQLKQLPTAQLHARLSGLPVDYLLDLADAAATDLERQVDRIPDLIHEGMERRLADHVPSRDLTHELLGRLRAR